MAKHETTVVLKAEDKTKKALQSAEGNMTRLNKAAKGLTASLGRASTLLGIGAAAGGLSFARSTLQSADALAKTSARLGVTTERLQELEFAASQSGIQTATLNMALQRFGRRLGEAAMGGGAAKESLEAMGVAVTNADGSVRDVNETFTEAVNKLGLIENAAQRNAIAMKLFDSEGVRLVQFGRNLDDLSQKARDAGLVIEDSLLRQAERTNDAWDKFSRQQTTRMKRFTLEIIRGGSIITEALLGPSEDTRLALLRGFEAGQKGAEELTLDMEKLAGVIGDDFGDAIRQIDAFGKAFDSAKASADRFAKSIETIQELQTERQVGRGTTLDALITSSKAREALGRGDTGAAATFSAQAAAQFAGIEEREGPQAQFGGFIQNQLAVARQAGAATPDTFGEAQKTLRLEIDVNGDARTFAFTEEGVAEAGKFANDLTKRMKQADKRGNGVVGR